MNKRLKSNSMKIIYIANTVLPTGRAHGAQIVKTCEALSDAGVDLELIVTNRKTPIRESVFEYYGARENFKITKAWCIDTVHLGWLGFWFEQLTFASSVIIHTMLKDELFFTRDEFIACCLKLLGKRVIWEAHIGQKNIFARFLVKTNTKMIVISHGLEKLYLEYGVRSENIRVIPDGVDLNQFGKQISQEEARRTINVEKDMKLIVYTGSRQVGKGVETLVEAGALLGDLAQVMIVSNKHYLEIPQYLAVADVLVIPNSAKDKVSHLYTSPMKLFEYMASGRPIVASNLPSIREVLDDSTAYFFEPDNPESLAEIVTYVLNDPKAIEKTKRAKEQALEYTWEKRAKKIIEFISK